MSLSKERVNEIAKNILQLHMEKEGIRLRPIEVKREVSNLSQKTGISLAEAAEFMKIFLSEAYNKTIAKLNKIMSEKVEE